MHTVYLVTEKILDSYLQIEGIIVSFLLLKDLFSYILIFYYIFL